MPKNEKEVDVNEIDEHLHQPEDTLKWRESYYFNWVDLENKISGFSTIGIVPNEKRREFVFLLFLDDKREMYYKEPPLSNYNTDIKIMLRDKRLSYELITPLKKWRIRYKTRKYEFCITFDTRFQMHYFGLDSSASWHQHFESSGIIKGELKYIDGATIKIDGFGQRDKSWGYRDWHQFDRWHAGHFQFKDWMCGFREDYRNDKIDLSGYIATGNDCTPISQIKIDTVENTDQFKSPLITTYQITDAKGKSYNIEAKLIHKDSFIRFARDFPGGYTELFEQMVIMKDLNTDEIGSGMAEQLRTIRSN